MQQKAELRQHFAAARTKLMVASRLAAQQQVVAKVLGLPQWQQASTVAIYWPVQGELNPLDLTIMSPAKHFYLPIVTPEQALTFARYQPETLLVNNIYGIAEPQITPHTDIKLAHQIDVMLIPTLGFDAQCHRLGMGKGYYDKTLATVFEQTKRPYLIGLAFDCQQADAIPVDTWDIALDTIITETHIHLLAGRRN